MDNYLQRFDYNGVFKMKGKITLLQNRIKKQPYFCKLYDYFINTEWLIDAFNWID